jgi:hypothetical protein
VGYYATYQNDDLVNLGFLRAPGGTISSFGVTEAYNTWPISINEGGSVTGSYEDQGGVVHGFVRAPDGSITSFDPQGSDGTSAHGINRHGTIAGQYWERSNNSQHGFIRAADGVTKVFDVPGSNDYTNAVGINAKEMITGYYQSAGAYHGFLRTP